MINTIFIHTAAVQPTMLYDSPISEQVQTIIGWHTDPKPDGNGWSRAGYHYLINQKGERAPVVTPETRLSYGAKGHNTGAIHICLWGGHGGAETDRIQDHYSNAQILDLKNLLIELKGRYPNARIRGHNEVAAKACPCFDVQSWLRSWTPEWAAAQKADNPVGKSRPTLRQGSRGAFVLDLQSQLTMLNYHVGAVDGHFGTLTVSGVTAFQSEAGLVTDGVVGLATWNALAKAKPRVLSKARTTVTEADLRRSGSRTIKNTDKAEALTKVGGGLVTINEVLDNLEEAKATVTQATSFVEQAQAMLSTMGVPLLILAGVVLVVFYLKKTKAARVDDTRSGANVGG